MANRNKGKINKKKSINHNPQPKTGYKLIRNWDELSKEVSETHYLEIEDGCGYIYSKTDEEEYSYLSTHSFYGSSHIMYTNMLIRCGFKVMLDNWDKNSIE